MNSLPSREFDASIAGPLEGVRVLDMSRLVAGNMATLVLADYGADVIKIERPDRGDDLRHWRVDDLDLYWKVYARNKRSLALDVSKGDGRTIFLLLVQQSHVLVENFVPGTLERWGYSPEALHACNPGLVILRISGWGQTGPFRDRPGFGTLVEAMSGYASLNGWSDRPPLLPPLALADMVAGIYGSSAVLAALRVAERGGGGQVIDLSLFEPIFSLIASEALRSHVSGTLTPRTGNQASHTAPRNAYPCADGQFIVLSGSMQSMAERIFETIGRPELKQDPRYATNDARVRHRDELDAIIAAFVAQRDCAENLRLFEAAGVTVAPMLDMAGVLASPYVAGRGVAVSVPDADLGRIPMHDVVPRLSATPGGLRRPAPRLGEHTREILAEIGWTPGERAAE